MFRYRTILVLLLLAGAVAQAQQEVISMAVLNSRKHRLGVTDNPLVGLFVSTDGGATWGHRGWKEYVRTFYSETGGNGVLWSACGNGVLRSTDNGENWRVTTGWEVTEVLKVKVHPLAPRRVAAATAYGMVITSDGGETWRTVTAGMTQTFCSDALWLPERQDALLAATEDGVYRTATGKNWRRSGLAGKGIRVLVAAPRGGGIWAGTEDDGLYQSEDGGETWQPRNNGLLHMTVYALAFHPAEPAVAYAGTYGGGVYRTTDGGKNWIQATTGMPAVHALYVLRSDPSVVLAGTLNGGLFRSADAGHSWTFDSQEDAQVWGLSGVMREAGR
jgi:photosystem II stability/assembly factor-like uncharacterized protein